jgi:hypothetical protein
MMRAVSEYKGQDTESMNIPSSLEHGKSLIEPSTKTMSHVSSQDRAWTDDCSW